MADSPLKRLIVQASHYSVTSLFALVSGLISFPLLTRIFSLEDYGVMNLIGATVTVAVAMGKVGVQHSVVRYHSEISAGKSPYTLAQLYSTLLFGMFGTSLFVVVGLVGIARLGPDRFMTDPRLRALLVIAAVLVLVQVIESAFLNLLRAEQKTVVLMKYQVTKKYLGLGAILFAVLVIAPTLGAFYGASMLAEVVAVATLAWALFGRARRVSPSPRSFSRPLYLELLRFGVPMMIGYELSGIILAVGDRYVIEWMLGEAPVGLYGAAYNLCQYLQALVIVSVGQAIMPIYMEMYDRKGAAETSAFLSRSLKTYVLFGAPVIGGLAAVGPELLPSLASEKYASAATILPWVIAGMVVDGANSMLGAGLFIHRKTRTIATIILTSAILNIGLNLVLVPRIGITGSAIATLVCYSAAAVALGIAGRHLLPVTLPLGTIVRAGVVSGVMYFAVEWIHPGHRLITVGVRALAGAAIYAGAMLLVDTDARGLLGNALRRFRKDKTT